MYRKEIKDKAISLRLKGKTYPEIGQICGVPKGTLSGWFKDTALSIEAQRILAETSRINLIKARVQLNENRRVKRQAYLQILFDKNFYLRPLLDDLRIAKIALAMLYLGEGAKNMRSRAFMFGNSDPEVVKLFLKLFRQCYVVDESKFRCTLQCRADQDTGQLQRFWYTVTDIPLEQFYKPRIDPRSVGQVTSKLEYKGVCRIDYFSTATFFDIMQSIKVLITGP